MSSSGDHLSDRCDCDLCILGRHANFIWHQLGRQLSRLWCCGNKENVDDDAPCPKAGYDAAYSEAGHDAAYPEAFDEAACPKASHDGA
ncbi:unnamed protein product [Darwinula stevensoni]|uniref:Uncharacterized protein n=1 Tax=Darwinula stevensoni TaxID=69355 RepID=A0A7R9ADX3_9CRUS|nr:unnamed protein product [Darwinula stevensoni]CAG0901742.1 unnamed protein product [Darwinula stevensoni]